MDGKILKKESGDRSQESGVRSQELGVRSQETEVKKQETGVRSENRQEGVRIKGQIRRQNEERIC